MRVKSRATKRDDNIKCYSKGEARARGRESAEGLSAKVFYTQATP